MKLILAWLAVIGRLSLLKPSWMGIEYCVGLLDVPPPYDDNEETRL